MPPYRFQWLIGLGKTTLFDVPLDGRGHVAIAAGHRFQSHRVGPKPERLMAVYTDVSAEELAAFLAGYDIGDLRAYKGIAEGVENSNFLVHTSQGNFILTLYEKRVAVEDLPFFLG